MNTRTLIITFVWMIMSNIGIFAQEHWDAQERIELNKGVFPKNFSKAIDIIQYDLLGIERGKSHVKVIDNNTLYINLSFSLKNSVQQGDWRIAVKPDFLPSFHWAPHLTPTDRNVIDQHVFRSPALIVADDHQTLILIPDLDIMQKGTPVRWYMDMDASSNTLILGMCNNHVSEHVLFERDQETTYPKGDIEIGFYLMYSDSKEVLRNPFKKPLEFMWSRWGHAAYEKGNPVKENLETYVKHTYNWAFNSWSENVWQQFELDGKKGVVYYNDSKGTNPDAAIKGIQAMNRPTLLIGGGYDKQSGYDEWIEAFDGKVRYLVLIGQTKEKIKEAAEKHGFHDIILCEDLKEAVKVCEEKAQPGDAVLLSPACASWGQFDNYEQRGDMFKEYVNSL